MRKSVSPSKPKSFVKFSSDSRIIQPTQSSKLKLKSVPDKDINPDPVVLSLNNPLKSDRGLSITTHIMKEIQNDKKCTILKTEDLDISNGRYFNEKLISIPTNLDLFINLKNLNLSTNQIKKTDNLMNLTKLITLDLSYNSIRRLEFISGLKHLKKL